MEAKDLRIGNITSAGVVNEILQDRFYVHDGESSLKSTWFDIKPIPLTEEWLLNLGFKKDSKLNYVFNLEFNEGYEKITVELYEGGDNDFYFRGNILLDELKHVHQLQNLYFILTGEELTIKE
jgi:hypothetical protein